MVVFNPGLNKLKRWSYLSLYNNSNESGGACPSLRRLTNKVILKKILFARFGLFIFLILGLLTTMVFWTKVLHQEAEKVAFNSIIDIMEKELSLNGLLSWSFDDKEVNQKNIPDAIRYLKCAWKQQVYSLVLNRTDVPIFGSEDDCAFPELPQQSPDAVDAVSKQILMTLDRHMSEDDLLTFDKALFDKDGLDTVTLSGFSQCSSLQNSLFFTHWNVSVPANSKIKGLSALSNSSFAIKNGNTTSKYLLDLRQHGNLVVQYIDERAKGVYDQFWKKVSKANNYFKNSEDTVMRFACFMTALGNNDYVQLLDVPSSGNTTRPKRLLASLNSQSAFPGYKFGSEVAEKPKKKYKLAYLLMVHENVPNAHDMIKRLHDNDSFILVHVDASSPEYKQKLKNDLVSLTPHPDDPSRHADNVQIMDTSFDILWGHISIVWAELVGYFQLLDLCEFSYAINLSGHDYPLTSNTEIYNLLRPFEQFNVPVSGKRVQLGLNYVFNVPSEQAVDRIQYPVFTANDSKSATGTFSARWWLKREMSADLNGMFDIVQKTSQWMVLHSSFIKYIRHDYRTRMLLGYLEHSMVPDESFFITYLESTALFSDNVFPPRRSNNTKRLIYWGGRDWKHPKLLNWKEDGGMVRDIAQQRNCWFMRKIDVTKSRDLQKWIDSFIEGQDLLSWASFLSPDTRNLYTSMLRTPLDANITRRLDMVNRTLTAAQSDALETKFRIPKKFLDHLPRIINSPEILHQLERELEASSFATAEFLKQQLESKYTNLLIPVKAT